MTRIVCLAAAVVWASCGSGTFAQTANPSAAPRPSAYSPPAGERPASQPPSTQQPSAYGVRPAAGTAPNANGAANNGGAGTIRRTAGETPAAAPAGNGNVIRDPGPAATNPNGAAGQPRPNPAAGPAANAPAGPVAPAGPQYPPGFPLPPDQQKMVDWLLNNWEMQSGNVQRFKCDFTRWEYDPANFGPSDPKLRSIAKTVSLGLIRYEAPSKGMFQVTNMKTFSKMEGTEPKYDDLPKESLTEHWVCDGKNVFEFDARNKILRQRELPKEMQGQAIADGPLPFLFGAKAEKMKARYWIRPVQREGVENVYWIEAYPKTRGDAANYRFVIIALDKSNFMPKILQQFPPNYDPKLNPAYITYQFNGHEVNPILQTLNPWAADFASPKTPPGWKKVVEPFFGDTVDAQTPAAAQGQAKKLPPTGTQMK